MKAVAALIILTAVVLVGSAYGAEPAGNGLSDTKGSLVLMGSDWVPAASREERVEMSRETTLKDTARDHGQLPLRLGGQPAGSDPTPSSIGKGQLIADAAGVDQ